MCGIAGIFNLTDKKTPQIDDLKKMISLVQHRGPDGYGFHVDKKAGLAHARLSIIDLEHGWQPIHNENKTIWIVFNGEIFNYIELRKELEEKGHRFYTTSDTETLVHLYEEYGIDCLNYLNGQFAFAIWDKKREILFVARDRVGICPLFYTIKNGRFIFSSEIKSIFALPYIDRQIDPAGLDHIFTFWVTIPHRTVFKGINELPPGYYIIVKNTDVTFKKYWDIDFSSPVTNSSEREFAEGLRDLLINATQLRLRADVPVGAYLSGGIDSSVITTLIKNYTDNPLRSFSIRFQDRHYDEGKYQEILVKYLNTEHSTVFCSHYDISNFFPEVIWHTERPILRTGPTPLYLLSRLVHENGYKVVLTGEGSDEILAGYDIFKETKVKEFIKRFPSSKFRFQILKKLYPYLQHSPTQFANFSKHFFANPVSIFPEYCLSHWTRWETTNKCKVFYSDEMKAQTDINQTIEELVAILPEQYHGFDPLSKAQYLEIKTLLPGYILSSQGDRMAMANSVEGRFPFLDHRVITFCAKIPSHLRMNGLNEKNILKESVKDLLPTTIIKRYKQPYRAPDIDCFFNESTPEYLENFLSERMINKYGIFDYNKVKKLLDKCKAGRAIGFRDNMSLVGILSTQLLVSHFIENFPSQKPYIRESERQIKYIYN